ncbi:glycosyltransferase family 4 protein [Paenibacillus gansuensis]|uniref:Glycosyltransferase family 4 protein n=1 Tax=Paenibacillus gansuensis TaxID=306542 RepID=A0ABW5PBL0_9BACL
MERVVEKVVPLLQGSARIWVFGRKGRGQARVESIEGAVFMRHPGGKGRYLPWISRRLSALGPDVIQVENRPRIASYLKKKHPRIPVWLSLHSVTFLSRPNITPSELRRHLIRTDRIIVNSEFLKQYLLSRYPILADRLVVNHLGVDWVEDGSRWAPEGEIRRQLQLQSLGIQGRKVILYAGRLIPIKGVHHLFPVMQSLIETEPDALLVVVGSAFYGSHRTTPYVRRLHQAGKKMPNHVLFVPYVPYNEMRRWFELADAAVVPSERNEAFGLVNVEAMAAGVPVVAAKAGGITEIVEDGVTGYLVRPEAIQAELLLSLLQLLGNKELRERMGKDGMLRAGARFRWIHTAERLAAMYRELPRKM